LSRIESLVRAIRGSVAPGGMTSRIIAIDGLGGAGKSTLAETLSTALAASSRLTTSPQLVAMPIVHTDDFASWDVPIDWWPRLVEQILVPLSDNHVATYQRYDWVERRLAEWRHVAPAEFLILEGVSSSRQAFRPYLSYTIWVETPREVRLRRGLERDGADALPLWESWMAEEDEYVRLEHPAENADLVIDGTVPDSWGPT
jgi:uridine kinase